MALTGSLAQAVASIKGQPAKLAPTQTITPPQSFGSKVSSFVNNNVVQPIKNAVTGGATQIQEGNQQVQDALKQGGVGGFVGGLEGAASETAGALQGGGAVLAPIFNVLSTVLQGNPNKDNIMSQIVNNPAVQKFAMSPAGQTTSRVVQDINNLSTIAGAGVGLAAGGEAKVSTPEAENIPNSPEDTLASRTADATPAYHKNMVGTNIMAPDTVDAQGNVVKGQITPRLTPDATRSTFESRVPVTSASEAASAKELANVPNYPDNGTYLDKGLSVQKAISTEAEGMKASLEAEDVSNPLDTTKQQAQIKNLIQAHVSENVPNFYEKGFPKTAAGRYYEAVYNAVDNYDGTRAGELDLRQTIDKEYNNARGKLAWGTDGQNALDEAHIDLRNDINNDLAKNSKSVDTQASLKKQSNLFRAKDVLDAKAQAESATAYGRLVQKYPMLGKTANILQRQGVMLPLRIVEAGLGVAAVGTYLHNLLKQQ